MNQELYEKFCHEYEKKGLWEHNTHGLKLKNCAEKYGERIALIDEQEEISYQELDLRSDGCLDAALGVREGRTDRDSARELHRICRDVLCDV